MKCAFCKGQINLERKVDRSDICPHCARDLRCCMQCKFFDPHAYNECREVSTQRIVDKQRANFCDYFVLKGSSSGNVNRAKEARKALEALFKK